MFGKERKQSKKDGQQTKALKRGRVSITTLWLVAGLTCLGAISFSSYKQSEKLAEVMDLAMVEVTKEASSLIAPALKVYIQQVYDAVHAITTSPQLLEIANNASSDSQYLDVTQLFAGAERALILPRDFESPDMSLNPPVSFAVVAQIEESRAANATLPLEVHWLNKQAVVETVGPIKQGEDIIGYLLVTWDFEYFKGKLSLLKPEGGLLEIIQSAPGGTRSTLMALGNEEARDTSKHSIVKLNGSHWLLKVYPGTDPRQADDAIRFPTNALWQSGGLVILVIILLSLATRTLFKKDVAVFRRMLDDAQDNKLKQRYTTWFKQSQAFSDLLRNQLREWAAKRHFAGNTSKVVVNKSEQPEQTMQVSEGDTSVDLDSLFKPREDGELPPNVPSGESSAAQAPASSESPSSAQPGDVFDIDARDEGVEVDTANAFPYEVIRVNDIRGVAEQQLTASAMKAFGRAFGSEVLSMGKTNIVVGRDGRISSDAISNALIDGILSTGCHVADIGLVPTPVLYFASELSEAGAAAMITGSHNAPEINGLKLMVAGETIDGERIHQIAMRIASGELTDGAGELSAAAGEDVLKEYVRRFIDDIHLAKPIKVVIDAANGAAGVIVVDLFKQMGCEVIDLYCDVDGRFPNHLPDTSDPDNLAALASMVRMHDADVGIAFDGDADRVGVVDSSGEIVWPDRILMLLAQDILAQHPGSDVVFDVKCSKHLSTLVAENGGIPRMIKTGHSVLKREIKEHNAILGGELSGHIVMTDRWFSFDDGIYAAGRILELLSASQQTSEGLFASFPATVTTPEIRMDVGEERAREIVEQLSSSAIFAEASVNLMDGIRAEYPNGWVMIRASNTGPELCVRFEADDDDALDSLVDLVRDELDKIAPEVDLQI